MTTPTREDYIREIYKLEISGRPARSIDIASSLGLAKSTVSERIRALGKEGLISFEPYGNILFTAKGKALGRRLTFKHRIIEVFLHETLKFPKSKVHDEAHKLEHAFSDKAILRLARFLGNPKSDPHGRSVKQ